MVFVYKDEPIEIVFQFSDTIYLKLNTEVIGVEEVVAV